MIAFNADALDIHTGGVGIGVAQGVLGDDERTAVFGHNAGKGMAGLVQVEMLQAGQLGVALHVSGKGVRSQRQARLARRIVPGPQREVFFIPRRRRLAVR